MTTLTPGQQQALLDIAEFQKRLRDVQRVADSVVTIAAHQGPQLNGNKKLLRREMSSLMKTLAEGLQLLDESMDADALILAAASLQATHFAGDV